MNILKFGNGISLIALVVTMLILLILAGVTLQIANNSIIEKAETASAETIEASTKEKVQFVLSEYQIDRYSKNNSNYDLKENLEKIDGVKNVKIIENNTDNSDYIELEYDNSKSAFKISENEIKETDLLLKKNVKIGDYIEYSKNYTDVYTGTNYNSTNGWRILDDGTMSENVRIISTGIPAKWGYDSTAYATTDDAIQKLLNCFNNDTAIGENGKIVKESNITDENFAESVSVLTLKDLNLAYYLMHNLERTENSIDDLSNDDDDLFNLRDLGISYWIVKESSEAESDIYFLNKNTEIKNINWIKELSISTLKVGVRPVITLKEGLTGKFENNIWKIN